LGAGLGYDVTENTRLRGGYKHTLFSDNDFSAESLSEFYLGARFSF
jgi:opacity protein-like surface antigen